MTVANTNGAGAVVNGESGGGGSSGPTTPAAALLNAGAPSTIVALDGSGVGTSISYAATLAAIGGAATVTTTRGDMIRRGASADERIALGASGTVLTSDGTDAVWAAIIATPGATVVDPMAGAGWTPTTPAGTSAAWTAGTLVLSVPSGVSGVVRVEHVAEVAANATSWDFAARLQATTGSGTTSASVGPYWVLAPAAAKYYGVNIRGDGAFDVSYNTGGGPVTTGYTASTLSLGGGQSWVRLSRTPGGQMIVWYGTGTGGSLPVEWTRAHVLDTAAGAACAPSAVQIIASGIGGAPAVNWGATAHAIRTTWSGTL